MIQNVCGEMCLNVSGFSASSSRNKFLLINCHFMWFFQEFRSFGPSVKIIHLKMDALRSRFSPVFPFYEALGVFWCIDVEMREKVLHGQRSKLEEPRDLFRHILTEHDKCAFDGKVSKTQVQMMRMLGGGEGGGGVKKGVEEGR